MEQSRIVENEGFTGVRLWMAIHFAALGCIMVYVFWLTSSKLDKIQSDINQPCSSQAPHIAGVQ